MRFILLLIIFSLTISLSFAQSQKAITNLYSNYLRGLIYLEEGSYAERMGETDKAKERYAQGLRELEKAKAKDPNSIHIRLKIATALIHLEKADEAIKVLKSAKEIDPKNLDVSLALIFIYSFTQDDTSLEKEYGEFLAKAHELKPKDIGISEYLAQFYFYKKNPQEAIKIYEKILETNPDYITAIFWLGYLYDDVGRRQDAINAWKQGLEIDETYHPILNSLGYIYAEEGINLDEAETMLSVALKAEPENGAYLDSLGWVFFKKGDLAQAEEYLTKAISYVKDPDIYEHLGDLYIELGDVEKAMSYYEEGLSHFPHDKDLKSRIKKYEKESKTP